MQQTRVIEALAEVDDDELLKLWEGLVYYSRARNLIAAAQQIVTEYSGEMPSDYRELLKLKGIGSYTAGAVSSIAFKQPNPAVDGNVLRVVTRLTDCHDDIADQRTKPAIRISACHIPARRNPAGGTRRFSRPDCPHRI